MGKAIHSARRHRCTLSMRKWNLANGVDLLENLDIRIQQLEANDYSQSLSHIQHVDERLIILEENSKLEHHNEKIHHRLVNLETNYENSAGPEII